MQSAILSSFASVSAEGWVFEPGPGGPPAISFWHFARAALTAGAEGLIPFALKTKPPPGCGSGKFGTPLARMHLANASAADVGSLGAAGTELVAPLAVVVLEAEVVELPTLATVGAGAGLPVLPPHPATRTPVTSVATATRRACGKRDSRFGRTKSGIWFPFFWSSRWAQSVLRLGWFPLGFPSRRGQRSVRRAR
jgi:hypothetical protein